MKECPQCGSTNYVTDRTCTNCGSALEPLRLKQPITLTITSTAFAVWLCRVLNWPEAAYETVTKCYTSYGGTHEEISKAAYFSSEIVRRELQEQVEKQGVDYRKWAPKVDPPIMIGNDEVAFFTDGSIKVGCQHINSAKVAEIIKRRSDVAKL